jgi:hypothetical protein
MNRGISTKKSGSHGVGFEGLEQATYLAMHLFHASYAMME